MHLHDATRRHYDLRLEVGGVLASFAVPRGPSLDPKARRLAVRTEDHPIEYLDFEAIIPRGDYGAGPMILWDRGRVRYLGAAAEQGLAQGKLDLELHGHKLHGAYALVRSRRAETEWLLIKKRDGHASAERDLCAEAPRSVLSGLTVEELADAPRIAEALEATAAALGAPRSAASSDGARAPSGPAPLVSPMLCAPTGAPTAGPAWLYELKLDGVRAIAVKAPGQPVALQSRRRTEITATYPEVARAVASLPVPRVVLDGEIVALDAAGQPSFQRLGARIHLQRASDIRLATVEIPVLYVAFDLLEIGARDLRPLPLLARKALLQRLLPAPGVMRALDFVEGDGRGILAFCRARKLEGAVAKRKGSPYREGARGDDWVKLKCERDDEFVIVGWTRGEGARARLGALDLASYAGDRLVYRGKVGSGFDELAIDCALERLAPLATGAPVAEGAYVPAPRGRTHVAPALVASVRYKGFSDEGQILHAVFRGLRDDIDPRACVAVPHAPRAAGEDQPVAPPEPAPPRVVVTNPRKVLWPGERLTKTDLCAYYEAIAPVMLPHLKDRPVMLVRYPDGIEGKSFYQWNVPPGTPSWIRTVRVRSEGRRDIQEVFLVEDAGTLVYIANLGAIPIHVVAGRTQTPGDADFLIMDFDVRTSSLDAAIALAIELRDLLGAIGLEGFPKTSGQSGLHVLVPLGPGIPHETARALADLLARMLVARRPEIATRDRVIARRGPRVYVDTGHGGRWRTIVAPYSLRAVPGATVSTPLRWEEVVPGLEPRRFHLRSVPARVADGGDPMAAMHGARGDLPRAVQRLEALLTGTRGARG